MAEVRFLGIIRDWMGYSSLALEAERVRELLNQMRSLGGKGVREHLFSTDGKPRKEVEILVNGRNIRFLQDMDTPLNRDDVVTIYLHGSWWEFPFL